MKDLRKIFSHELDLFEENLVKKVKLLIKKY
jgi:hypothetical protein